ncbi:MAG TPA: glycosyltransferase family 39 protein [Opitutaceae bacterium]|nr:glycosyltransferase family 39 protein [Opitutaceae bacterium]
MKPPPLGRWALAALACLLALHFTLAVSSKLHESTTSDEIVHLTGGYSYWKLNDYRIQPENGNLAQRWVALPTWLMNPPFPDLDSVYWRTSDGWTLGHQFFYETHRDHFPLLMSARAMTALVSAALGALIFLWSRRLFGTAGAFVSLTFFAFSPTFLAHGGLATSDVFMGFFMIASVGAWWRSLSRPGFGPFLLSAVVFGLACVAKYSAPFIIPMMALCAAAHLFAGRKGLGRILLMGAGHAAAAFIIIWAFYGFRYSAFNPALPAADQFIQAWPEMYARTGTAGAFIHVLADHHVLPEGFLYGTAYVVETTQMRGAYLNGEYSVLGWHSFFLWTFLLKSTVPFLVASALAVGVALGVRLKAAPGAASRTESLLPFAPLASLFVVYWILTIQSHLNIGHRHLIPMYPVLFIMTGALGAWLAAPRGWRTLVAGALIAWHIGESLWIYPDYIAYFNEIAGGPRNGRLHLVDSSLDWGQDLPGLKTWLSANKKPGEEAYLAYFGTGEPRYYDIPAKRLSYLNAFHEDEPYIRLGPGLYCVGATMLQEVYSSVRGDWTIEREREYQLLRSFEPQFRAYAEDPEARRKLDTELAPEKWTANRDRFLHLRFARLCYYLRVRKPDAVIGYSIFVYRLSADEVRAATAGSLRDWTELIERSGEGAAGG